MKTTSLIATSALAAAGYAVASSPAWSPMDKTIAGTQKFSLSQRPNAKYTGVKPVLTMLNVYLKYATSLPNHIIHMVENQPLLESLGLSEQYSTGGVRSEALPPSDFDSEYVVPFAVGTPPQHLAMNLDTGSADLWVFSTESPSSDKLQSQPVYRPSWSRTSKLMSGAQWRVKYGDKSSAQGTVYVDKAAIGPVHFDRQAIQIADSFSSQIAGDDFFSGILGMASSSANTVAPNKQLTFLDNIKNSLANPIFTANLQKGGPGNYNFGYLNESEYIGDIAFTPINTLTPYWEVQLSGYKLGDDNFNPEVITGIVDTGTSLMMFPQHIVDEYYAKLPGSYFDTSLGSMLLPCNMTPPDFVFGVGDDYRGRIPGHYLNYASHTDEFCYGGLQSSKDIPFAVFGDILIKAQFIVFDRGNLAVGFANKPTVPAPIS